MVVNKIISLNVCDSSNALRTPSNTKSTSHITFPLELHSVRCIRWHTIFSFFLDFSRTNELTLNEDIFFLIAVFVLFFYLFFTSTRWRTMHKIIYILLLFDCDYIIQTKWQIVLMNYSVVSSPFITGKNAMRSVWMEQKRRFAHAPLQFRASVVIFRVDGRRSAIPEY